MRQVLILLSLLLLVPTQLSAQRVRSKVELSVAGGIAMYTPIARELYPRPFKAGFALDADVCYHFHPSAYTYLAFGSNSNQTLHNIYQKVLHPEYAQVTDQDPKALVNSRSNYHLTLGLGGYYYQNEYFRLALEGGVGVGTLLLDIPDYDAHWQLQQRTESVTHARLQLATGVDYYLGAGMHIGLRYDVAYLFRSDLVHTLTLRFSYRLPHLPWSFPPRLSSR